MKHDKTKKQMEEAWLSGALEGVQPILMPAAHALRQAARDIEKAIPGLTVEELRAQPNGAPSAAFHLRHIAGSIDRLLTYARAETLTAEQFAELAAETKTDDSTTAETLARTTIEAIENAVAAIETTPEKTLFEKRTVGRKQLPTNVFGLLFHVAEHTQRHVGQATTTAKIVGKNK